MDQSTLQMHSMSIGQHGHHMSYPLLGDTGLLVCTMITYYHQDRKGGHTFHDVRKEHKRIHIINRGLKLLILCELII